MKKRIVSALLLFVLFASLLSFTGCMSKPQYRYSGISTHSAYSDLREEMDFIYEDTFLLLEDDGSWRIYTPLFLFFKMNIDKGTYTVEDGVYTFEGFEYGMETTGEKTDDGFTIYMKHDIVVEEQDYFGRYHTYTEKITAYTLYFDER